MSYLAWISARLRRMELDTAVAGKAIDLPFTMPPPVWSYSHHAIVSGIAAATGRPRNLQFNYYVNLRCPNRIRAGSLGGDTMLNFEPSITIGRLGQAGMIEWRTTGTEVPASPLETLVQAMLEGFYPVAIVDKYFIPGTAGYRRAPTPHWVIFYKHLPERQSFAGAAYRQDGDFREVTVPYGLLNQALLAKSVETFVRKYNLDRIQFVRVGNAPDEEINPRIIARQLEDYMACRDNARSYLNPNLCNSAVNPPKDVVYGIQAYERLREHLLRAVKGEERIDLRATRAILEHKELMYSRVKAMAGLLQRPEHLLDLARQDKAAGTELQLRAVSQASYREEGALKESDVNRLIQSISDLEARLIPAMLKSLVG